MSARAAVDAVAIYERAERAAQALADLDRVAPAGHVLKVTREYDEAQRAVEPYDPDREFPPLDDLDQEPL